MPDKLTPHFEDVQAHYDLSDDFFRLFLDPTGRPWFVTDEVRQEDFVARGSTAETRQTQATPSRSAIQ